MKLVSLNVEWNKHLERVLPFIRAEKPDVLCLQELVESDVPEFEKLGYSSTFLPNTLDRDVTIPGAFGIGLFTKTDTTEVVRSNTYLYHNEAGTIVPYDKTRVDETMNRGIILNEVVYDNETYLILTTHFPDAPNGSIPTKVQTDDLTKLLRYTNALPPHIICGDFNLPRNENPLYDTLAHEYHNAVPASYRSSLDRAQHRLANVPDAQILFTDYMVDHLLLKEPYTARDVRLHFGVSDHAAIVATISKRV